METDIKSIIELMITISSLIFLTGGVYAINRKLPELMKKLEDRMDSSDKKIANMEISQATSNERMQHMQRAQDKNQERNEHNLSKIEEKVNKIESQLTSISDFIGRRKNSNV